MEGKVVGAEAKTSAEPTNVVKFPMERARASSAHRPRRPQVDPRTVEPVPRSPASLQAEAEALEAALLRRMAGRIEASFDAWFDYRTNELVVKIVPAGSGRTPFPEVLASVRLPKGTREAAIARMAAVLEDMAREGTEAGFPSMVFRGAGGERTRVTLHVALPDMATAESGPTGPEAPQAEG